MFNHSKVEAIPFSALPKPPRTQKAKFLTLTLLNAERQVLGEGIEARSINYKAYVLITRQRAGQIFLCFLF